MMNKLNPQRLETAKINDFTLDNSFYHSFDIKSYSLVTVKFLLIILKNQKRFKIVILYLDIYVKLCQ